MVTTLASPSVIGSQVPQIRSVPEYAHSRGQEAIEVAESVGLFLDDWQKLVLIDACGCRSDDRWAAFETGVEVARQNGKGGILEARELAGLLAWGERRQLHSAHEFQTSMEAMLRMEEFLASTPEVAKLVKSISRSHGSEGFVLWSGQRLRYRTRTKGGGRGFTGDFLAFDEAMVLQEAFVGALLPTLSGRSLHGNPQVWYAGSAVDQRVHEHGLVFARLRARALAGGDPSLAYFGWTAIAPVLDDGRAATPEDLDLGELMDRAMWAASNPGLGIRISEEHIANELRSMGARTFAVERLGVGDWPDADAENGPIDIDAWDDLVDVESSLVGPVGFVFDVSPDRAWSTISAAGRRSDGLAHIEVVARQRGTKWVPGRLVDLLAAHENVGVGCDATGPAASLLADLEQLGVEVTAVAASEHAQACGRLFDAVGERGLRHLGSGELRDAVKGASTRPLGDAWAWSRKTSATDISPLVSCTLALWIASTVETAPEPMVAFA